MGRPDEEDLQPSIPPQDDVDDSAPPDGGYAWVIAFSMWLINGGTWGVSVPPTSVLQFRSRAPSSIPYSKIPLELPSTMLKLGVWIIDCYRS